MLWLTTGGAAAASGWVALVAVATTGGAAATSGWVALATPAVTGAVVAVVPALLELIGDGACASAGDWEPKQLAPPKARSRRRGESWLLRLVGAAAAAFESADVAS